MKEIRVKLFYRGKWQMCQLSEVKGAGNHLGSMWHLHVNEYYAGALHWSHNRGFWFGGNISQQEDESLAYQLESVIISWYG